MKALIIIGMLLAVHTPIWAQDSIAAPLDTLAIQPKRSLVARLLQYFSESDKPKPDKKIDFGIIGGPHYASDTGLGVGLVASALYSTNRSDSTLKLSNASLYSDVSTKGFLMIGLRGNTFLPHRHYRIDYRLYVYTFPSYLWGFNFPQSDNNDNKSKYNRTKFEVMARFLVPLNRYTYLGPIVRYQYVHAYKLKNRAPQLLAGQPLTVSDVSVGLSYTFDSRDFMLNASRGWFVQADLTANPTFLGNNDTYWSGELQVSTYRRAWRGAVIAGEFHTRQSATCPGPCSLMWGRAIVCAATTRGAIATRISSTPKWSYASISGIAMAWWYGWAPPKCFPTIVACDSDRFCPTLASVTAGSSKKVSTCDSTMGSAAEAQVLYSISMRHSKGSAGCPA